jgi:hypothetical protein
MASRGVRRRVDRERHRKRGSIVGSRRHGSARFRWRGNDDPVLTSRAEDLPASVALMAPQVLCTMWTGELEIGHKSSYTFYCLSGLWLHKAIAFSPD